METWTAELWHSAGNALGEGPIGTQSGLYWVDINGRSLNYRSETGEEHWSFDCGQRIGAAALVRSGGFILGLEDGVYLLDAHRERLTYFAEVEREVTGNRCNDGKCDPGGRFVIGTMTMRNEPGSAGLYRVGSDASVAQMRRDLTISNGLAWTSDRRTFFHIDTPTRQVVAFDHDIETGAISNKRVAYEVREGTGFPDGMAIDREDHLWIALWNGHAVIRVSPTTREIVGRIDLPVPNVTSCAFGGSGWNRLYITTASVRPEQKDDYPEAGHLFAVDLPMAGEPLFEFDA